MSINARTLFLSAYVAFVGVASAQAEDALRTDSLGGDADSLRSQVLRELVVQGRRARIEDGKIVVMPSRGERKLSNSPASLLRVLNIPFLKVENDVVTARGNRSVAMYINGVPMSNVDMSTFWPMNVTAVEYIEDSTDPAYGGDAVVVNFVMKEYEAGGNAKVEARQSLPDAGVYTASAKMQYKSMTYGFMARGTYTQYDVEDGHGVDTYRDIYYRGQHYDELSRTYSVSSEFRARAIEGAFVARYIKPGVRADHQVGFVYNKAPLATSSSEEQWSPSVYDNIEATNATSSHATSFQASGYYNINNRSNLFLVGNWAYSYDPGSGTALYRLGGENAIFNGYTGRNHHLTVRLNPFFKPSEKFFMQLRAYGTFNWSRNTYRGSTESHVEGDDADIRAGLRFCWLPSDEFWLDITPGAIYARQRQQSVTNYSKALPWATMAFFLRLGENATLRGGAEVSSAAATAASTSDVTIRMSELMAVRGNPYLGDSHTQGGNLCLTWLPSDRFNISLMTELNHTSDEFYSLIVPAPIDEGGMIFTTLNGPERNEFSLAGSLSGRFFGGNLSFNLNPEYRLIHYIGPDIRDFNALSLTANISYVFKGVMASFFYSSPRKMISGAGMSRYRSAASWNFSLGYGTGNLYLQLRASNLFRKYMHSRAEYVSDYYTSDRRSSQRASSFSLDVSYTFDFGKKGYVDIDIPQVEAARNTAVGDSWH